MDANQQPLCEAFIMTGESMLNLSRNQTDNNKAAMSSSDQPSHNNNSAAPGNNNNNNNNNFTSAAGATARAAHLSNAYSNHNTPKQAAGQTGTSERKQDDKQTGRRSPIEFKCGLLDRKSVLEPNGHPTGRGRRGWRRVFVTLKDLRLLFRYTDLDSGPDTQPPAPAATDGKLAVATTKQQDLSSKIKRLMIAQSTPNHVKLHHSFAKRAAAYSKRPNVFRLQLADRSECLMQAASEPEMESWIEMINFASACLSTPALACAVSNGKRFLARRQRPILPASHTKLTYWQQLIDHEERLQRLKQELEEHLNEALTAKSADKRAKSDFIERIAHLRLEIERYSAYVELMRKRSNSAEAIILSKHPQNASMAPSAGLGQARAPLTT